MATELFSSIQSLTTKLLEAIRGTTSPDTDRNESVREDLEKLSQMLARIQAVQQDAEEREIHDRSVRLWLAELRGVAYQAEDVLDEFYYEVLRSIVESGDAAVEAIGKGVLRENFLRCTWMRRYRYPKCKDFAEFLCNFAASGNLEQQTGASKFAYSSKMIWDLICDNKRLSAADHKLAMSTHVCNEIKDEILNSLNQDKGYRSLPSDTSMSVMEFNRELLLFLQGIYARYEEETKAFDENIRQKVMDKMQEETLKMFGPTFEDIIESLSTETLSSLKSNVHDKLKNLIELEHSFVIEAIKPYMAEFDDNSRADVHPYFQKVLEKQRKNLEEDLTRIVKEEANKIQIERDRKKLLRIILGSVSSALMGVDLGEVIAEVIDQN